MSDISINDLPDDLFANIKKLVKEAPHAEGKERDYIFTSLLMNAAYDEEAFRGLFELARSEVPEISKLAWSSFEDLFSREDRRITAVLQKGLYELGNSPQTQGRFFEALSKVIQTHPEYRWPVKLTQALAHSPSKETAKSLRYWQWAYPQS